MISLLWYHNIMIVSKKGVVEQKSTANGYHRRSPHSFSRTNEIIIITGGHNDAHDCSHPKGVLTLAYYYLLLLVWRPRDRRSCQKDKRGEYLSSTTTLLINKCRGEGPLLLAFDSHLGTACYVAKEA